MKVGQRGGGQGERLSGEIFITTSWNRKVIREIALRKMEVGMPTRVLKFATRTATMAKFNLI